MFEITGTQTVSHRCRCSAAIASGVLRSVSEERFRGVYEKYTVTPRSRNFWYTRFSASTVSVGMLSNV